MHDRSSDLTLPEAWDGMQVFLTGPVVAAGAVPGTPFCAPGLICLVAVVLIPPILAAILLSLVAILLLLGAAPALIVRAILSRAHRRRTFKRRSTSSRIAGAPGS
jgi:hypothetical protein